MLKAGTCVLVAIVCGVVVGQPLQDGVVYFLPATPAESLAQLEAIKADGFNMVKIASWVWTVPHEGSDLRKVVDATLDWCDAHGMDVWLLHNIQYGSPGEGGDIEAALRDPTAKAAGTLLPWAQALKGHPSVAGVLLGNEVDPGGVERFEGHPAYLQAFRDWLKARHSMVDVLNARWRTAYQSFDDVQPPETGEPGIIDATRFIRGRFADFYNTITEEVLRPVLGDKLYGSKGGASPYILRQMPAYNVASWDDLLANWPLWKTKLLADTTGLPVFNSEVHLYHDKYGFGPSAKLSRYRYFTSALLGEWMTASFAWGSWQKPDIAEVHASTPPILADLRRVEKVLRLFNRREPSFQVLVTEANESGVQDHPALEAAYAHAASTGLPWSFIADMDLGSLRAQRLVVCSPWLTTSAATALAQLPAEIDLLFVGTAPPTDEYGLPLPEALVEALRSRGKLLPKWSDLRSAVGASDLPPACREIVDVPYLWWSPERGHHHFPVKYPRVEALRADSAEGRYVALVNHTRKPVTTRVPFVRADARLEDLLTGSRVPADRVELGPLAVHLIRTD